MKISNVETRTQCEGGVIFFNWSLDSILKRHAKCHQLHHHICLLLGPYDV